MLLGTRRDLLLWYYWSFFWWEPKKNLRVRYIRSVLFSSVDLPHNLMSAIQSKCFYDNRLWLEASKPSGYESAGQTKRRLDWSHSLAKQRKETAVPWREKAEMFPLTHQSEDSASPQRRNRGRTSSQSRGSECCQSLLSGRTGREKRHREDKRVNTICALRWREEQQTLKEGNS